MAGHRVFWTLQPGHTDANATMVHVSHLGEFAPQNLPGSASPAGYTKGPIVYHAPSQTAYWAENGSTATRLMRQQVGAEAPSLVVELPTPVAQIVEELVVDPTGRVLYWRVLGSHRLHAYDVERRSASSLETPAVVRGLALGLTPGRTETVDLSIVQQRALDDDLAGGVVYTLTVRNAGPLKAADVVVSDTLPVQTTLMSAETSRGDCEAPDNGVLTCALGDLSPNALATIVLRLTLRADAEGDLANLASVASRFLPDHNLSNNASTDTLALATDLALSESSLPTMGRVGEEIRYHLVVTNDALAAPGTVLTLTVPSTVTVLATSGTQGSLRSSAGGRVVYDVGLIPAGGRAEVDVTWRGDAAGPYAAEVVVAGRRADLTAADNARKAQTVLTTRDWEHGLVLGAMDASGPLAFAYSDRRAWAAMGPAGGVSHLAVDAATSTLYGVAGQCIVSMPMEGGGTGRRDPASARAPRSGSGDRQRRAHHVLGAALPRPDLGAEPRWRRPPSRATGAASGRCRDPERRA